MSTVRDYTPATLLPSGLVLVAGGSDGTNDLASVELFDPTTGTFRATGSMSGTRGGTPSATLLHDGKVLIAGGATGSVSAEIYDPSSGTFSPTGAMKVDRGQHTATRLKDGRVLLAGGVSGDYVASAEIYDPTTRRFTATGSMKTPREDAQAVLLHDGRVLVVGGDQGIIRTEHSLKTAEIYDPKSGRFTATGSMHDERTNFTATLLVDGRVLVVGGYSYQSPTSTWASAEIYDSVTGRFTATGSMSEPRSEHSASLLKDGRVLIAGGEVATCQIYDPATAVFSVGGQFRGAAGTDPVLAVSLKDGPVLFPGLPSALYWP